MANALIASMVLAIWLYLLAARGGFWLAAQRDDDGPVWNGAAAGPWPAVAAVIPARDEAECVAETIASLLRQNYPGEFHVILVDDQSRDGTAQVARDAAAALGAAERLTVVAGTRLPAGWTGKLWAQQQGVELAETMPHRPDYLLLTDADIVYAPDALAGLVARAQAGGLVLTSLMVETALREFRRARCSFRPSFSSFRCSIRSPGSTTRVARPRPRPAAACWCAATRCAQAGGIAAIRGALIDDCALGAQAQEARPDLARPDRARAQHPRLPGDRRISAAWCRARPMRNCAIRRCLLAGTVVGLALTYLAPVALDVFRRRPRAISRPGHLAA